MQMRTGSVPVATIKCIVVDGPVPMVTDHPQGEYPYQHPAYVRSADLRDGFPNGWIPFPAMLHISENRVVEWFSEEAAASWPTLALGGLNKKNLLAVSLSLVILLGRATAGATAFCCVCSLDAPPASCSPASENLALPVQINRPALFSLQMLRFFGSIILYLARRSALACANARYAGPVASNGREISLGKL